MIGRLIFPLCLCCAVLCAFVGYLSKRSIKEAKQILTEVVEVDCGSLIENRPKKSAGVLLSDYVFVDRVASIDIDGDGKWDEVAVPLFSKDVFKSKARYKSVIACFRGVPDMETLNERLAANKIKVNYRVRNQSLDSGLHSTLAKKFKNMDFENSPVVTVGYGASHPVLGKESLKLSYRLGAIAIVVGVLSLVFNVLAGLLSNAKLPQRPQPPRRKIPAMKRKTKKGSRPFHYDVEPTGGVLDRVRSMRDKQLTN